LGIRISSQLSALSSQLHPSEFPKHEYLTVSNHTKRLY
jgi:hypothetical protein